MKYHTIGIYIYILYIYCANQMQPTCKCMCTCFAWRLVVQWLRPKIAAAKGWRVMPDRSDEKCMPSHVTSGHPRQFDDSTILSIPLGRLSVIIVICIGCSAWTLLTTREPKLEIKPCIVPGGSCLAPLLRIFRVSWRTRCILPYGWLVLLCPI